MNSAILNNELIAVQAGKHHRYNYDSETREYISASTEYLAQVSVSQHIPV